MDQQEKSNTPSPNPPFNPQQDLYGFEHVESSESPGIKSDPYGLLDKEGDNLMGTSGGIGGGVQSYEASYSSSSGGMDDFSLLSDYKSVQEKEKGEQHGFMGDIGEDLGPQDSLKNLMGDMGDSSKFSSKAEDDFALHSEFSGYSESSSTSNVEKTFEEKYATESYLKSEELKSSGGGGVGEMSGLDDFLSKDTPPPIPKHSFEMDTPGGGGFTELQAHHHHPGDQGEYEDEYEDSHKLSDSLEVLKESPQMDDNQMMDFEGASNRGNINEQGKFPSDMVSSGLFSQKPPESFNEPPITQQGYNFSSFSRPQEPDIMTSSLLSGTNPTLDDYTPPKFDDPDDYMFGGGGGKTPEPVKPPTPKQVVEEPKQTSLTKEKDYYEDFYPKDSFESIPSTYSSQTKFETEAPKEKTPPPKKEPEVIKPAAVVPEKKVEAPKPKVSTSSSYSAKHVDVPEDIQQILNILCPKNWFDPKKLHPKVSELVYWRDPKKSGAVFGTLFVVLIAFTCLSFISVLAYTSLAVLSGTFAFRVYKSIMQAIQKTNDGHPFKEYLDMDLTLSSEKAQELSNCITNQVNNFILKLRRLFLVEDLLDSAKFGAILYLLTYIGGWFNGLTLLILAFLALFSLPKVYEQNKVVIDQYLDLVLGKFNEINEKVSAAIPFGKKEKAQ